MINSQLYQKILAKSYQNLLIFLRITVDNVRDVFQVFCLFQGIFRLIWFP